jgi:hypothetical protein
MAENKKFHLLASAENLEADCFCCNRLVAARFSFFAGELDEVLVLEKFVLLHGRN